METETDNRMGGGYNKIRKMENITRSSILKLEHNKNKRENNKTVDLKWKTSVKYWVEVMIQ